MENNINGIIIDGRVYKAFDRKGWNCSPVSCDLYGYCQDGYFNMSCNPCIIATKNNPNIGFRFSQEMTDKINTKQ